MKRTVLSLLAVATAVGVVAAWAQTSTPTGLKPGTPSAKEIRGASPYAEIKNEPAPKLFVDPPLPDLLDQGVVWIQWRVENANILPVFGKGALHVSPRVGHLHVHVDDVPWWWADASNINTIDLAGLLPGPHKIRVVLVDANHEPFPGQSKTVTFTIPKGASRSHSHQAIDADGVVASTKYASTGGSTRPMAPRRGDLLSCHERSQSQRLPSAAAHICSGPRTPGANVTTSARSRFLFEMSWRSSMPPTN